MYDLSAAGLGLRYNFVLKSNWFFLKETVQCLMYIHIGRTLYILRYFKGTVRGIAKMAMPDSQRTPL